MFLIVLLFLNRPELLLNRQITSMARSETRNGKLRYGIFLRQDEVKVSLKISLHISNFALIRISSALFAKTLKNAISF